MSTTLDDPATPDGGRSPGDWYAGPVPERHAGGGFVLARLTAAHAERDHAALMASVAYLRRWSDSDWPADDFSVAENREELGWHDEEHEARIAFTYSVLDAVRAARARLRVPAPPPRHPADARRGAAGGAGVARRRRTLRPRVGAA